jgi:hypothetical protein
MTWAHSRHWNGGRNSARKVSRAMAKNLPNGRTGLVAD